MPTHQRTDAEKQARRVRDRQKRALARRERPARPAATRLALAAPPAPVLAVPPPQEDIPMALAPASPGHWVRFTLPGLHYFTYHGTNYDRGQLIALGQSPRDEQLERMGFVQKVESGQARLHTPCGVCGAAFLNEQFREAHGRERHRERFAREPLDIAMGMAGPDGGAALRDTTGDADERRLQAEYPLYLEKTRASLEG